MAKSVKLAGKSELAPGEGKSVEVEGLTIALFNIDGSFCAIDGTCTHVGGPLGEGSLERGVVTCPWHGAQFDVKSGKCLGPPAEADVRSFAVKIEGDDVVMDL